MEIGNLQTLQGRHLRQQTIAHFRNYYGGYAVTVKKCHIGIEWRVHDHFIDAIQC